MNAASKIALAVALTLGGASTATLVATDAAVAQRAKRGQAAAMPAPTSRKYNLSKAGRAALAPAETALTASNFAGAQAALTAAQPSLTTADDRYIAAGMLLRVGVGLNDQAIQRRAIDAMIASGAAQASEMPALLRNAAALAQNANDRAAAERYLTQLAQLTPGDAQAMAALAESQNSAGRPAQAAETLNRAITARVAAGQTVEEAWYKRALAFALNAKSPAAATTAGRALVSAYPTATNWRDSLLVYEQLTRPDAQVRLDLMRLQRATGSLAGERDYFELADMLNDGGYPAEARAVLDAGVAARQINPSKAGFAELIRLTGTKATAERSSLGNLERQARAGNGRLALSTADVFYGYGDYAKSAELYQLALTKGGVDAATVNLRLGAALAQANRTAEARTALQAVTGPRQELANYWLAYLSRRA
ncbi:MAG: hypothetical protein AVDCRST_MAG39-1547 [uncultured Sphingomonadaceae bacterium]|uniref:Tetratricopeptide repeat protein n=1 Tax=uncultured Sphingomonadaceae bacterium TaxID=169976 RepID=A0A6J4SSD2_9SPHN|nr:MAG: hypothetical protein AVDCRST_MAG39-1547 [uncultured Sphingomonadaceae bacterium]